MGVGLKGVGLMGVGLMGVGLKGVLWGLVALMLLMALVSTVGWLSAVR